MQPLPLEDIVRELKRYRYDRTGQTLGGYRVPLKTFGEYVGISRQMLGRYINGQDRPREPLRRRMSQAIIDIRAGRLRFRRCAQEWVTEGDAVEAI